jgi:phosphatidylglycerol:prolipoprotein diacylglycerol transferase
MSSHGGMLGVALAAGWFTRRRPYRFLSMADLIVTVAPLGLCFGRIANFINGELWGKATRVPWAVIFPASPHPLMPRHPSQLYAAALEGLLVFGWMQIRFWKSSAPKQPGQLSGEFLVVYSVARAISEIFREPDAALLFGLSRGTFYSLFFCAAGLALIASSRRANLQRKA